MATITVTNTNDSGAGSLRQALLDASTGDTVDFSASLAGQTITLTSGALPPLNTLTLDGDTNGDDRADITIDANGQSQILTGISSTLKSLNLTGAVASSAFDNAIDILNARLEDCYIYGNSSTVDYTSVFRGNATLERCTVADNSYSGWDTAIFGSSATLNNVTIEGNSVENPATSTSTGYSAIFKTNSGAQANLTNVTITGNTAGTNAQIFHARVGGEIFVTNTIVLGNTGTVQYTGTGGTVNYVSGNVTSGAVADVFQAVDGTTGGGLLVQNAGSVPTAALNHTVGSNPAVDVGARTGTAANGQADVDVAGVDNDADGTEIGDAGAYELSCFAAGTAIAVPGGETPVEALRIGDLVRTADGRDVPVLWIGVQAVGAARARDPRVAPVLIEAGAFENAPYRDLLVTADHALYLGGYLINAACLVGQPGVGWAPPAPRVFYHIETEAHELLMANGCPAESFCALQGRAAFDNRRTAPARIFPEMDLPRISAPRLICPVTKRSA